MDIIKFCVARYLFCRCFILSVHYWLIMMTIKKLIHKFLCRFYFYDNGRPKRCTHCHSVKIDSKVKEWLDVGVGNCGPILEEEYFCVKCGHVAAYWAYGYFDPYFMMEYLMVDE